ncbi:Solute carrier family 22 member 3 [Armadillidium nasatum]|uniref:Solute carrier family 22 member 3 n=1 Tax=Armadillidium nasatum TaxID=96803 RepID=A0A5N5SHJ5_9CRUS|nr:Solute carrier family 22 member 3 [Armadillidium nasatum]
MPNTEKEGALESKEKKDLSASEAFGLLLEHVGGGGKFQLRIFFIASISGAFFSFNSVSAAFLAASPEFKCNAPTYSSENSYLHIEESSQYGNGSDIWKPKCHYFDMSDSNNFSIEDIKDMNNISFHDFEKECESWSYDDSIYKSTVVTEWDLVCEKRWMMSFVQASYMIGILTGSLVLSELSDTFGRRKVSLLASVGFFLSSLATTFSMNFVMFLVLRFISAFFISGMFIANFVLVMEFCSQEKRSIMGIMYQIFSAISLCILPLIAYYLRNWRSLQLAISIPSAILLLYFKLLPESPRWLFCKGREEEAMEILRKVAEVNKRRLPDKQELEGLLSKVKRSPNSSQSFLGKLTNFLRNQVQFPSYDFEILSVGIDNNSVGIDNNIVSIDNNNVGIDNNSVIIDKISVGIDKNSVGIDNNSVGIDNNSLGIDNNSVCIDKNSVDIDNNRVVIDNNIVGIDNNSVGIDNNSVTLVRTPNMRRRCLIIYYSWFVVSMVYYGITFNGANINASVYLLVFLGGVAELLSYFLGAVTLKRFGRRLNISFCYIFCGLSCMLILAVPKAFSIAYIYSAELVPTRVRNVAVGTSSMWARVGSILAPFIVDLLGQIHYTIPSTIFGILSILAGILDLFLPETSNHPLPETIEEVEAMDR